MSYNSKRTIVSMIAGSIVLIAYFIYTLSEYAPDSENLKSWAITILVFIGIGIAGLIVVQILFHVGFAIGVAIKEQSIEDKEIERMMEASMIEDERDKLINLKAAHIGYTCAGLGLAVTLTLLAFGGSVIFALHILLGAFSIGSLIEGAVSVYLYERGVHNG